MNLVKKKVNDNKAQTSSALITAKGAVRRARSGVFVANKPPIWKLFRQSTDASAHANNLGESGLWVVAAIKRFYNLYEFRIIWHVLIFILILTAMIVIRIRSAKWDLDQTSRQTVEHVFKHPVATALLISIFVTRLIYPDAPSVIFELAAFLSVPILAILVPHLFPRSFLKYIYVLFAVVVFFPIIDLLAVGNILGRLVVLTLSGVAVFILSAWSRKSGPTANLTNPKIRALILAVVRIGSAIMFISFAANIIGMVELANLLFLGTLVSAYVAILIFVSLRIIRVFLTASVNSNFFQSFASVRKNRYRLVSRGTSLLRLLGICAWLYSSLRWFGVLEFMTSGLKNLLSTRWTVGSMAISIGSIVAFFVALWASVLVSRFVRTILREDVLPRARLGRGMPETISLIVNYAIVAFGFFIALAAAGIELSEFAIVFGAFGVGIGFGLQTIVNNFISGLILIFERPIQVGDTVELGTGGLLGVVRNIGIRASTIRTFSGAEVIVPNGDLVAGQVTNWTLSDVYRRIDVIIGVAYGTDPHKVIELLLDVAKQTHDVLKEPEPSVIFKGFGESSLDFELRAWTDSDQWYALKSDLTVNVHDAIVTASIHIPFPQRDLHFRSMDPGAGESLNRIKPQEDPD